MEAKPIVTQASQSLPPNPQGIEPLPPLDAASMIIIDFVIISMIAALIYACIPKKLQHPLSFKPRFKVPCHYCRYFSRNPHLKCALHPVTVLTEHAVDCTDYHPCSEVNQAKE
jgi:hypothetical protein